MLGRGKLALSFALLPPHISSTHASPPPSLCPSCPSPPPFVSYLLSSSIDMYNNDVSKESAQKFMKQTGALKDATLYFAS